MSRTRRSILGATLGFYALIVAAVLSTSWLVRLDWQVMLFRPYKQWPELHGFLDYFVVLGQRGPTAVLIAAWLGWRSWRQRTLRPLLVMATALLLLNVSVGAAKLGMAREGPHYANVMGSNEMFLTGDIFPSGHTANAVVTWGILAYLATTSQARRILSVIAAVFALGVGTTTVYLGTHWVTDVLLGWAAGLAVLLAMPWFEPLVAWAEWKLLTTRDALRTGYRAFRAYDPEAAHRARLHHTGQAPGHGREGTPGDSPAAAPRHPEPQPAGAGRGVPQLAGELRPWHPHPPPRPQGHPGQGEHPPARPVSSH
ncbi:phosphatase PAP2 family protein [Streptomyces sp. YIM 98790]|uniref:phosphatase PAP2 family protein n=1 Tax=Streptomyces sp. YIM 98790 TaxID=2689077 RepID=UPI001407E8B6|nr:phosphatase PAP2 family protein [Streptomyces sp. YIM 98790]